jgi:hypothetical protein
VQTEASGQATIRDPHRLEDFEGAGKNRERFRCLRSLSRAIDNAAAHAVAE